MRCSGGAVQRRLHRHRRHRFVCADDLYKLGHVSRIRIYVLKSKQSHEPPRNKHRRRRRRYIIYYDNNNNNNIVYARLRYRACAAEGRPRRWRIDWQPPDCVQGMKSGVYFRPFFCFFFFFDFRIHQSKCMARCVLKPVLYIYIYIWPEL